MSYWHNAIMYLLSFLKYGKLARFNEPTLDSSSFFLLKTSLAATICADGASFFTPVCPNAVSDQKQGSCSGQGCGDKLQLGKCYLLGKKALWERYIHRLQHCTCNLHPILQGHILSTAGGQIAGVCQELHLAHGVTEGQKGCNSLQHIHARTPTYI